MKRIAFYTLGCKVNQVETEQMIEAFSRRGYQIVNFGDPADVYVVNTCTVTHISDRKSRAMLRRATRNHPGALVVATGCVAEVDAEQLNKIEGINAVIGNRDKDRLTDMVDRLLQSNPNCGGYNGLEIRVGSLPPVLYTHHHQRTRAFVKIEDGCESFCSYCIVPYARGPVRSKAAEDVLAEIKRLVFLGYREIVLTGIHTGLYGKDLPGWNLAALLEYILKNLAGTYRLRLSSIEPLELNERMLDLFQGEDRICRHLHIPLQSGSNRILASMKRKYDRNYYRDLILRAAAIDPGLALTADVMVGYPTETEDDFNATYELISQLPFYDLHVFKYSMRAGTAAAGLVPQVDAAIKHQRSESLLSLAQSKKKKFLATQLGQQLEVLVEKRLSDHELWGISDNYMEVKLASAQFQVGELINTLITAVETDYVWGAICPKSLRS
jgi:threonylcarbamoyladenosine tRNA methylthiotransferase MtaB